jgi:uncharacterized small protein (DUF1192 family)
MNVNVNVTIDIGPGIKALGSKIMATLKDFNDKLDGFSGRLDGMKGSLDELKNRIDTGGMTKEDEDAALAKVGTLEEKIAALEAEIADLTKPTPAPDVNPTPAPDVNPTPTPAPDVTPDVTPNVAP